MANSAPFITSPADGIVLGSVAAGQDYARRVLVQPDGKIVVVGNFNTISYWGTTAIRYNVDGSVDASFGTNGEVSILGVSYTGQGYDAALQSDGKIVIAGTGTGASDMDFIAMRLNANGTVDTSFGLGGVAITPMGASYDAAYGVAIEADGKIVVTGGTGGDFGVAMYTSGGWLDTGFDGDGKVLTDMGFSDSDTSFDVAIQQDGKIVVVGTSSNAGDTDVSIARYNTDGTLDRSFSSNGKQGFDSGAGANDTGRAVLIQSSGKIVAIGVSNRDGTDDFQLVRYSSDGSVDTSFGTSGSVRTAVGTAYDWVYDAALQADDKILVTGTVFGGSPSSAMAIVRYTANGALDPSFGTGGKVILPMLTDGAWGIAVQQDGKILVTGNVSHGTNDILLMRLNADGSLDTTFGATHFVEGGAATIIDDSVTVFDQELAGNYNGASLLLTRAGGERSEDVFGITGALSLLTEGGQLKVNGALLGTVNRNSGGALLVTFDSGATQELVETLLHQITYTNTSEAPPATADLTWTISDGNTGAQGSGGPKSASTTTVVHITGVNDAPVITSNGGGASAGVAVLENQTLVTTASAVDPDSSVGFGLGGTDADKFVFVGDQLHFKANADFDTHTDANGDGIYDVTVIASDGALSNTQALSVSLIDVPGNKVKGTSHSEKIDTSHKIKGKGATAENDKLDGKAGNDTIKGGGDNDTIIGGEGKDTLKGDAGHDRFVFNVKLTSSNVDLIKDFKHDTDVIALENKVFKTIGAALGNKEFYAKSGATEAHDKNDRIIYDKKTGKLYYDDDGNKAGGHHAVQFATLDKHPVIDAGDFLIV